MKLSVLIPCYKFKDYVIDSIESVVSQITNFPFEILVRDDMSDDGTYEMLMTKYKNYPSVTILRAEKNLGPAGNFVELLNNAKGVYVAILDGDDYLIDNNYYQRAVDFLDNNKDYSVVSAGFRYLQNGIIHPPEVWLCGAKKTVTLSDMLEHNYISAARVFRKISVCRELFDGIPYPDWLFNFELLKYGNCMCETEQCSAVYRIHKHGMFSETSEQDKYKNATIMRHALQKYYNLHVNYNHEKNVIVHIHLFLNSEELENIAYDNIKTIKSEGFRVLITSPKILPSRFYEIVDVFYHDKENQLLQESYSDVETMWHWMHTDSFKLNFGVKEIQKHGLAVLRSMIKGCQVAKFNNIKYIFRMEFDDLLGKASFENIRILLKNIVKYNYDFCLIRNIYSAYTDVSVHVMIYDCNKFLNVFGSIVDENSYNVQLYNLGIPKKSTMLETFIYLMVEKYKSDCCLNVQYLDTKVLSEQFSDSKFNIHQNCFSLTDGVLSDVAYVFVKGKLQKKLCLAARNFSSPTNIDIIFDISNKDGSKNSIKLEIGGLGGWSYFTLDNVGDIDTIKIKNNNREYHKKYNVSIADGEVILLDTCTNEKGSSYIDIKE